jgi:Sec-independent protein translocase protein TatA
MTQRGSVGRFFLALLLLVLVVVVFILLGGGTLLKEAGTWISGVGKKAEEVKPYLEKKAATVEKGVNKGIDSMKQGEKK